MFLDYFALGLLDFRSISHLHGIIVIHDILYEIAKERNYPHQDAIHVSGWASLFHLYILSTFLDLGDIMAQRRVASQPEEEQHDIHHRVDILIDQVNTFRRNLTTQEKQSQSK